jgi:hypothetical protein
MAGFVGISLSKKSRRRAILFIILNSQIARRSHARQLENPFARESD